MIYSSMDRRRVATIAALALLAGCKVIPKAPPEATPTAAPTETPSETVLPADIQRHRVALLLPLAGSNGAVGQAIANATTMALLDTNAQNLRITTYDTSTGAASAAARAIADGNKLILGPLLSTDITAVAATARPAKVPIISYSNDETAAARDIFIMGSLPSQSVARTVSHARAQGATRFAALVPAGEYGQRVSTALSAQVRAQGGTMVAMESFDRANTSLTSAANRLRAKGGYDAVMIADGGRIAVQAGSLLKVANAATPRILGTELWSGEAAVSTAPALRGAWFAAVSDARFRQYADSYRNRFGTSPYRVSTLGYDSVLLTLRIAREWKPGSAFPVSKLFDRGGFLGLDGAFRFRPSGVVERSLEVRQVRAGGFDVVSAAPAKFED